MFHSTTIPRRAAQGAKTKGLGVSDCLSSSFAFLFPSFLLVVASSSIPFLLLPPPRPRRVPFLLLCDIPMLHLSLHLSLVLGQGLTSSVLLFRLPISVSVSSSRTCASCRPSLSSPITIPLLRCWPHLPLAPSGPSSPLLSVAVGCRVHLPLPVRPSPCLASFPPPFPCAPSRAPAAHLPGVGLAWRRPCLAFVQSSSPRPGPSHPYSYPSISSCTLLVLSSLPSSPTGVFLDAFPSLPFRAYSRLSSLRSREPRRSSSSCGPALTTPTDDPND
ncbi:hypothetical protein B0H14DRAFT_3454721 [Mycena olivaceomarginata]|nr:hypothetical protein B0H14DRAFT_3454721 [Mycena olivaceomarginata]